MLPAVLVVGLVEAGSEREGADPPRTESLLMIMGESQVADFRLVDLQGRVAVIAIDSAMCAIPGCSVSKDSDFPDHDEANFDPESLATLVYGGGVFTLEEPPGGVWYVEAFAARGCEDSCRVGVFIWSMKHVNQNGACWLRPGEGARWRMILAPPDQREGRVWARIELERKARIAKLGPRKP
jgi:hypothetical protein